jgi:hypothetical protein
MSCTTTGYGEIDIYEIAAIDAKKFFEEGGNAYRIISLCQCGTERADLDKILLQLGGSMVRTDR